MFPSSPSSTCPFPLSPALILPLSHIHLLSLCPVLPEKSLFKPSFKDDSALSPLTKSLQPVQFLIQILSVQFKLYAEMGAIFTAVSEFIMVYIALVAAVSIWFFYNVTSLGKVCIRRGSAIKVLFCHFMAFVNYSGAMVWVILGKLLRGIPVLILKLQDVCIYLIFVHCWALSFVTIVRFLALITHFWGNRSWGKSNSHNYFPLPLLTHCCCISGRIPLENSSHQSSLAELKLALLCSTPEYNANAQKFSLHWSYVIGMWELVWPSFSIITKCWTCKNGKMSLKMRRPSISLRHMAGMKSTQPRQSVCQGRRHSSLFDVFMLHPSTEHLPSSHPCLHLLLGFLCGWLLSHGPSGTPGNGIMRQVSVRHRGCERLFSVWLKSLMRRVLGFLSNHNPYCVIIPDQEETFSWWISW